MAQLTVYGTPISVYVRVVRLLLEQAGAEYNIKEVGIFNGENTSADYLAKNPFGKVPMRLQKQQQRRSSHLLLVAHTC